jgi:hypothetical protein
MFLDRCVPVGSHLTIEADHNGVQVASPHPAASKVCTVPSDGVEPARRTANWSTKVVQNWTFPEGLVVLTITWTKLEGEPTKPMSRCPRMLRNLSRIVLAVVVSMTAAVVFTSSASAAVRCLGGPSWYVFHHGETSNGNVVVPLGGQQAIIRDASFQPSSQYFMVCEDLSYGWGAVRLYSNTTKMWLGNDWPDPTQYPNLLANMNDADAGSLFYLCDLDGNWLQLRHAASGLYVDHKYGELWLKAHRGGGSLYKTTPRLNHLMPRC